MKKITALIVMVLVLAALFGCAGSSAAVNGQGSSLSISGTSADFSEVQEKEWRLIDLLVNGESIGFDREKEEKDFAGLYTLQFENERFAGTGAPNRYFGPYTHGEDGAISISQAASTLMASLREPDILKEHEYFNWINNVYGWSLVDGNLHLLSKDNEKEAVLIFTNK